MSPYKANILIAEDSQLFRTMLGDILIKEGFSVQLAVDGSDALNKITSPEARYDLLLLDIQMPNMDGLEMLEFIKSSRQQNLLPPTLIITSSTPDSQFLLKLRRLGASGYIIKSQPKSEIIFRVKSATRKGEEKIKDMRELCSVPIEYSVGNSFLAVKTFDFNKQGAYIATTVPAPVDTILNLKFTVPTIKRNFATRGKVIFHIKYDAIKKGTYPPGMGIKFLDLTDDDQTDIEKYLNFLFQKKQ
jgi:CheY-like chemotaxis protein